MDLEDKFVRKVCLCNKILAYNGINVLFYVRTSNSCRKLVKNDVLGTNRSFKEVSIKLVTISAVVCKVALWKPFKTHVNSILNEPALTCFINAPKAFTILTLARNIIKYQRDNRQTFINTQKVHQSSLPSFYRSK